MAASIVSRNENCDRIALMFPIKAEGKKARLLGRFAKQSNRLTKSGRRNFAETIGADKPRSHGHLAAILLDVLKTNVCAR